jgi:hypothetical protein
MDKGLANLFDHRKFGPLQLYYYPYSITPTLQSLLSSLLTSALQPLYDFKLAHIQGLSG